MGSMTVEVCFTFVCFYVSVEVCLIFLCFDVLLFFVSLSLRNQLSCQVLLALFLDPRRRGEFEIEPLLHLSASYALTQFFGRASFKIRKSSLADQSPFENKKYDLHLLSLDQEIYKDRKKFSKQVFEVCNAERSSEQ